MIILASKSPRRKELLSLITEDFVIKTADVDENLPKDITPNKAVEYLSKIKAEPFNNGSDTIIGADTVVAIDGIILGKPKNRNDAFRMLKMLSGKYHSVFTGVTVIKPNDSITYSVETKVKFFDLTDDEINNYINTDEPYDKAGSYGIQGKGALLVEKIDGDYFNVVGLPISTLNKHL
ncbi:MAG: Maf family protein [Eubacterium sp.]|nr:Maf family protein [Eubacterium sp.]MDE6768018.1 Maf family protein [Eubacterium sp.]